MKRYYPMIEKLREANGFTQEQMAEKMNMSQGDYSKFEKGKIKRPEIYRIDQLKEIFNVHRDFILDDGKDLLSSYIEAVDSLLCTKHMNLASKYERRVPYEELHDSDMDYIKMCLEVEHVTKEMYEEVDYLVAHVEPEDEYLAFKEMMEYFPIKKLATIFFSTLKPIENRPPQYTHSLFKEWERYDKEEEENKKKLDLNNSVALNFVFP
ncbi:MAG: helix-turn-helix transcriptional regulator [Bacteroidota bacterium]